MRKRLVAGAAIITVAATALLVDQLVSTEPNLFDEAAVAAGAVKKKGLWPGMVDVSLKIDFPLKAREMFYPSTVYDYFDGMDTVAVKKPDDPSGKFTLPWLRAPVYQLMDRQAPDQDQIESFDPIEFPANFRSGAAIGDHRVDTKIAAPCAAVAGGSPEVCEVLGRNTWMMWTKCRPIRKSFAEPPASDSNSETIGVGPLKMRRWHTRLSADHVCRTCLSGMRG